jgi:2-iminobutanoate/2-iminopropanoate deaminase
MDSYKIVIESLDSSKTPKAIGPYSKATKVKINDNTSMIFTSAASGINPETNTLIGPGIKEQTAQTLENLKNLLEYNIISKFRENGSSLENISKITVFLADLKDFQEFNEVYMQYFTKSPPARSTYEVKELPLNFRIGMEAFAFSFTSSSQEKEDK